MNYFKYFAPGKLILILPVACLVAGVVAFTLLGRSGELTAMKASGVSMRRAMAPVLVATMALCAVLFVVQDRIAPVTNQRAQEAKDRIQGKPPRTYGLSVGGRWTFGTGGRYLYHYRLYDPDHQTFQGLSVFTLDRSAPRVTEHRFASVAKWSGTTWLLERGWYRTFPADKSVGAFRTFEDGERCALDPPENFARREITLMSGGDLPDQMNILELRKQIETLQDSGYDITRLEVAFYAKLAHPVTPLVMVLLGLPFAFQVGRRGSLYGIGVALVLVIVYWATFAVFNALGFETVLPPFLAAWAPNILYGLLGSYLLLYVKT
jgi:LPS export ABC transporter permease LptG